MPERIARAGAAPASAGLIPLIAGEAKAQPPRVWFAPLPAIMRPDGQAAGATDFDDLFRPGADWGRAGQRISVFKIYGETLRHASDAQLVAIAFAVHQRGMRLALELPVLTG